MSRTISCNILTPEKTLYEGNIDYALLEAHDGKMGFLYNHAPLISELGHGEVRLARGNKAEYFAIEGGIIEIRENKMIILAEKAYSQEQLKGMDIEQRIKEIDESISEPYSQESLILKDEKRNLTLKLKIANRKIQ